MASSDQFEFRAKIESWLEGLLDTFDTYLRTLIALNLRPFSTLQTLAIPDRPADMSSPFTYFVLSYILMSLLITGVDFSSPVFPFDLADRLQVLGITNAAQELKIEALVRALLPALVLLFALYSFSSAVMRVFREDVPTSLIRRNYTYMLGGYSVVIATAARGFESLVMPIASTSWWLGLVVHVITILPLIGVIVPAVAITYSGRSLPTGRSLAARTIATTLPIAAIVLLQWLLTGTVGVISYMKLPR